MIELVWDVPLRFPDLKLDKQALEEMGKVIEGTTLRNIKDQVQTNGAQIKRNSAYYALWKRAQGWGSRSLVAGDHSLVKGNGRSFQSVVSVSGRYVIVKPAAGMAADRTESVQEKGYTGWFGISARAVEELKQVIANFVIRSFKQAAKK